MQELDIKLENAEGLERRLQVRLSKNDIARFTGKTGSGESGDADIQHITQSSFRQAMEQLGIQPVTGPVIEGLYHDKDDGHGYTALFEVYPDIPLPDLDGYQVSLLSATVDEDDVDRTLTKLRKQHSHWEECSDSAAQGDRVTIDLKADVDGTKVDEPGLEVVIGEDELLEGLAEGLTGVSAGDRLKLKLKFPDVFFPDLAGKQADFDVTVSKVETLCLPEADEEFIRSHGLESGNLDNFKQAIRNNMESQMGDAIKMKTTLQVMADLYEMDPFNVPRALIEKEVIRLISDPDKEEEEGVHTLDLDPAEFEGLAHKRVARSLLATRIAEHHGIELDEARLRHRVEQLTGYHPDAERKIKWYYEDRQRMGWIETEVLEYQVVEWIMNQAEVVEVPSTFDEIMRVIS